MADRIRFVKPDEIEARSMEIIESEMPEGNWSSGQLAVVKRCIHASADFDYAENLYFSPGAVEAALTLFKSGRPFTVVTDTNMAAAGINRAALSQLGGTVRCFMAEPDVAEEARARGMTRAAVSMERAACLDGPVLAAIGNAPTALIKLHELIASDMFRPAFLVSVPVGFVNVVESKELIIGDEIPCIVARGRKGGSNIAAAILNALMYQVVFGRRV